MQNTVPGSVGIHSGCHYTIGGDAGSESFNSPADLALFLHHGMIDRVWWTWQNRDLKKKTNVVSGTLNFLNSPPSRDATLGDAIIVGRVGLPNITVADAVSTLGGPFCYVYA
jgi:tyrosinase